MGFRFCANFTERNIVQTNDLQKTKNLSACLMKGKGAFILKIYEVWLFLIRDNILETGNVNCKASRMW